MIRYSVVIPTVGRPCLGDCLAALAAASGPAPEQVVVVDDRAAAGKPLHAPNDSPAGLPYGLPVSVVATGGAGPAAARNAGWRRTRTPWVAFLDDDVRVGRDWRQRLTDDLSGLPDRTAGVQGRITVPAPEGRRPTDWERGTMGLAGARWITADMAYRRAALAESGGFDERFPRAFREDADLALRLLADGWELRRGRRHTVQAAAGRPKPAIGAAAAALAGTAEFAAARIISGPRTAREVAVMTTTSLVIPELACWHWVHGRIQGRQARPWPPARAVLFDRDGTLIRDVPYNGDPALVEPMPGAAAAVTAARRRGLRVGMITNQSGIARGLVSRAGVEAVNARIAALLGPFDVVKMCPHGPVDGCACRKPAPGMVLAAAADLAVAPHECTVIGDIAADVQAARAAGARAVLVPDARTLATELIGTRMARDVLSAVHMVTRDLPLAPVWPGRAQ